MKEKFEDLQANYHVKEKEVEEFKTNVINLEVSMSLNYLKKLLF